MTPEQITALKQLAAQYPRFNEATAWANGDASRPVLSMTPQPPAPKWTQFDQFRITQLRALANAAGITAQDLADPAAVQTKIENWFNPLTGTQKANLLLGVIEFLVADLMDKMPNAEAADTTPVADAIEYGDTWAVANGFPDGITEDIIREALRA